MAKQSNYHHGDLRKALVDTSLLMLEELGLEGLSLRKIAARVGVSHAAPEHHFPTLRHLLNALAVEGFTALRARMLDETAPAATAADRLRGILRGYVGFAAARPHLFRLMFNRNRLDWEDEVLGEAGQGARTVLAEISKPLADRLGLDDPAERLSLEHLVWSQAHGYAHLLIDGKIEADSAREGLPPVEQFDLVRLLLRD